MEAYRHKPFTSAFRTSVPAFLYSFLLFSCVPFEENMAEVTTNVRRGNAVSTKSAPDLLPVFSQAIRAKDAVFVSGNIGVDPSTGELVQGVKEQTVRYTLPLYDGNAFVIGQRAYVPYSNPDPNLEKFQSRSGSRWIGIGACCQGERVHYRHAEF